MKMNKAFTTIELLVATGLSVLLMVGLLQVVAAVQRDMAEMQASKLNHGFDRFVDILRWDLAHARTVQQDKEHLTLVGYNSLDRRGFRLKDGFGDHGSNHHQPVRVTYRIKRIGSSEWLIRFQTDLDILSNRNTWSEPVCFGIDSFKLEPVDVEPPRQAVELAGVIEEGWFSSPRPVPDRVRVIVRKDANVHIDRMLVLR